MTTGFVFALLQPRSREAKEIDPGNEAGLTVYIVCLFVCFRDPVAPKKEAKVNATFTVTRGRKRNIVVSFQSDQLAGVRGECVILKREITNH